MIPRLNTQEADMARESARRVVIIHQRVVEMLREGVTLAQVDSFIGKQLEELKAKSSFLGYRQSVATPLFPGHACLSVNECVVHGTVGYHTAPLKPGDVLKIDVGVNYRGFMGDAAWTYAIREQTDESRRLMECGRRSLEVGVPALRPGNTYLAWAQAVQPLVEEKYGFHLVHGLGGHGLGRKQHDRPYISNVVPPPGREREWPDGQTPCMPGHYVAVETMIGVGTGEIVEHRSRGRQDWPVLMADGSMSVHYEHDVLITEQGPETLTADLANQPDIVG